MENNTSLLKITVNEEDGIRLDSYINIYCEDLSRSRIAKLITEGNVSILRDETDISSKIKPSTIVKYQDIISVIIPQSVEPLIEAECIPLSVLYEDDDVIVVDKPKGMVVHPACGHYSATLVNALMYHCSGSLSGINGILRPGIVHRIDKDTSGSIIACKNDYSHNYIAALLKEHSINRVYRAIVTGRLKEDEGIISAPIGRHPTERKKMAVVSSGKHAVTHYKVLAANDKYTYVEFKLETGRTHQIRVHMAHIGHPLVGDTVYGNAKNPLVKDGQILHAMKLGFTHPRTEEYVETIAPLPEYFIACLKKVGLYQSSDEQ